MLYLFMAVIFLVLFSAVFFTFNAYKYHDRQEVVAIRVHTMNDFAEDLHEDLHRAAFISGFRAMIGLEEYLSQRGVFFHDQESMEEAFRHAFINGTINGTSLAVLDDSSFEDYLSRVGELADRIGLSLAIDVTNVTLEQVSPWHISISFDGEFLLSDNLGLAWWAYNRTFMTVVPIYDLKDPLYTVNTAGRVPNTIINFTSPPTGYVDESTNDTAVLQEFVEGSYYRESDEAPSFLQRFTNDLSPSPDGIESLVYLPALSDQGIVVKTDRSVVDHVYFSASPDGSGDRCQIQNMVYVPDWFRLGNQSMDDYELDALSSSPCS